MPRLALQCYRRSKVRWHLTLGQRRDRIGLPEQGVLSLEWLDGRHLNPAL